MRLSISLLDVLMDWILAKGLQSWDKTIIIKYGKLPF